MILKRPVVQICLRSRLCLNTNWIVIDTETRRKKNTVEKIFFPFRQCCVDTRPNDVKRRRKWTNAWERHAQCAIERKILSQANVNEREVVCRCSLFHKKNSSSTAYFVWYTSIVTVRFSITCSIHIGQIALAHSLIFSIVVIIIIISLGEKRTHC